MEKLIQNADFFHDNEDKREEYNNKISDWKDENEENIKGSQLLSAIQALNKKLTSGKCPKYDTQGWQQAMDIYDDLIFRVARDLMDDSKLTQEEMRTAYYNLYLEWFKYGPATIHLKIMEETFSGDVEMEEYLQGLKGAPKKQLMAAMMTPITKKEDTPDEQFYEEHRHGMDRFIGKAFDKSTLLDAGTMKIWLNYVFHLYLNYLNLDDNSTEHLMQEANDRFNDIEDGWESYLDARCLKALIGEIAEATKTPGFPKSEQTVRVVRQPISKLTQKLIRVGDSEKYSDSIFDLLEALSVSKGDPKHLVEIVDEVLRFFTEQKRELIQKRIPFFKAVAPRFKKFLESVDVNILQESECCYIIVDKIKDAYGNDKTLVNDLVALLVPLLKRPCLRTIAEANTVMACDDQIRWKDHKETAKEVFKYLAQVQLPTDKNQDRSKFIKEFRSCVANFLAGLRKARILKEFGEGLMYLGMNLLELKLDKTDLYRMVEEIGESIEIDVKQYKVQVMEVMRRIDLVLQDENLPWTDCWELQRAVQHMIEDIIEPVNDGSIFTDEDLKVFTSISNTCMTKDALNPSDGALSAHFDIGRIVMIKLIEWMASTKRLGQAVHLVPLLMSKFDEDEENVDAISGRLLNDFAKGDAATVTSVLEQLIKLYLDKDKKAIILLPINTIYPFNPEPMTEHFQRMLQQLIEDARDEQVKTFLIQILLTASKKQPELFTEVNMKDIIGKAKSDPSIQTMLILVIQEISRRKPDRMLSHLDLLMDNTGWDPTNTALRIDVISTLALHDESQSNKVVDYLLTTVQTNLNDKPIMLTALNAIRLVGFKYINSIKPRREDIAKLAITDGDGQTLKQTILDMIDGKTPDKLRKQMEEQQEAIGVMVNKVEEVEGTVVAVKDDLGKQDKKLEKVKKEVKGQGQRLDQVEETVEDTVAKVEEIDGKTLSHAPYWSRDISKLLNPASDHDWRLLSSRLGYSNSDIRGWAQQADPCMAMLNEWYATRKTSQATYAILTNLQEMNRMDAALIVENAMKKAEAVVEDEEFEYASPPEIFISYQWGHQEEVKLLHRHLAMAGYDCWMDIGQMGGGDKLFEKIDNGMRAAKLVISCVTTKYAKSPNCNREVNLAVGVNKPIIPLLFENCVWPPPGSMGPIFSESLYIRFFQTGEEQTKDDRYWSEDKFQELLMQLSVNGLTPDEGKIDKIYRNWWMPLEEQIIIDKSKTRNGGKQATAQVASTESEESPDVFISYQWGKQKNIIKLYQRLTSLGFSCWLDIKQMGGGDSLYDKIDRGIRGSKVVVSCVTKKYALSPNCRREVSLTDALKKPMLPLLLEDMTWPPSGPMSMIMTQLLYIGFQAESAHTEWSGPQFDELVSKIHQHIPKALSHDKPSTKPDNKPAQPNANRPNAQKSSDTKSKPPVKTEEKLETEDTKPTPSADKATASSASSKDNQSPQPAASPAQSTGTASTGTAPNTGAKSKSCSIL